MNSVTTTAIQADRDVAVIGAGPAGLWLAVQLARCSVDVAIIDPRPNRVWPNNYGIWLDEISHLSPAVPLDRVWDRVVVWLGDRRRMLHRSYGRIDNAAFGRELIDELEDANTTAIEARVDGIDNGDEISTISCSNGQCLTARLVVDATGGGAGFLGIDEGQTPAFQRAYGVFARIDGDPLEGAQMVLMDYRRPWAEESPKGGSPQDRPSFLYAMHLGEDRYFLEETVLVGPGNTSFDLLRHRLENRLQKKGFELLAIEDEEHCHIPMGTGLPESDQLLLGFGASAAMVHPATGYQMARMLRAGPELAELVARGLHEKMPRRQLCRRYWQHLWPPSLRRARKLLVFGRDLLLSFDHRELCSFFDTFFALSDRDWADYLSGECPPWKLAGIMWRCFSEADGTLRGALARRFLIGGRPVFSALLPVGKRRDDRRSDTGL